MHSFESDFNKNDGSKPKIGAPVNKPEKMPVGTAETFKDPEFKEPPLKTVSGVRGEVNSGIKDRDWSRNGYHYLIDEARFVIDESNKYYFGKTPPDIIQARHTKAFRSYTNTSLGGNFPINTAYRFTDTADVNIDRLYDFYGSGEGRFYTEAIEANAHDIHIRFGVQKFNTGISFFSNWFDYHSYTLGQHGRAPSFLYNLGQIAGVAMGFMAPTLVAAGWLIKLIGLLGGGKFWYVSPSMPLYWTAVTTLFNELTGAMSLTLPKAPSDGWDMKYDTKFGEKERSYIGELAKMMPGVYEEAWAYGTSEGFSIDVRRIATRCQALENQLNKKLAKRISQLNGNHPAVVNSDVLLDIYDKAFGEITNQGQEPYGEKIKFKGKVDGNNNQNSTRALLIEYLDSKLGRPEDKEKVVGRAMGEKNATTGGDSNDPDSVQALWGGRDGININPTNLMESQEGEDDVWDLFYRELMDGSGWLTLRVDGTGSVSESFSNSTQESQLAGLINGWASSKRQLQFNFMGGALLGDLVNKAIDYTKDFIAGNASSLGFGGLLGFVLGSKIDIPKTYADSSASLPKRSYTLKLRTPYAHPICIAQDLYLPLCCILAGALPISHGRNAYGGPFYCELYDRGRAIIKNGIISNVSVTRATSGVAWTSNGIPLGLDVSFDVENLDTTFHMPLNTFSLGDHNPISIAEKILVGNEGALQDYISTLAGLSLSDNIYRTNNFKRNFAQVSRQFNSYWDRDHWIQRIANSAPGRAISLMVKGTSRR